jgi:hypothetical protein
MTSDFSRLLFVLVTCRRGLDRWIDLLNTHMSQVQIIITLSTFLSLSSKSLSTSQLNPHNNFCGGFVLPVRDVLFSLYSRCCSACNFVRFGTLLQLSSSNHFLLLYSLIHAVQLLPTDILSVRDVILCQHAYSIASYTKQWN